VILATELLARLDHVVAHGDTWRAKCPAHDGQSCDSLSISETDETVLLKCWGGCENFEVLSAVGLEFRDLYPIRFTPDMTPAERKAAQLRAKNAGRQSSVKAAANVLALEATVLGIFGRKLQKILHGYGVRLESKFAEGDLARFREAQDRIDHVQENLRAY
jgi:hypothetical protein